MKHLLCTLIFVFSQSVLAKCMVHYKRTACDGVHRNGKTHQEISYKKCGGKQECTKEKSASSLGECQAAAVKACANKRYAITKSKVITATWKGSAIKDTHGNDDFCLKYDKRGEEFFRCNK